MKKLSTANHADVASLSDSIKKLHGFNAAEGAAQAFINTVYDYFEQSFVLLRLFSSIPYSALSSTDRQLVDKKANDSETKNLLKGTTPILTLLGTRGHKPDWNVREMSKGFRCIPLTSSAYVASLSMLSMQFRQMQFDFTSFDTWDTAITAKGRADHFTGMLYVKHAALDKDEQGRMIVPRQDFVAENEVKTVLGFGSGYPHHPTIVTLFAFTNETLEQSSMKSLSSLLEDYVSISEYLISADRIFS